MQLLSYEDLIMACDLKDYGYHLYEAHFATTFSYRILSAATKTSILAFLTLIAVN